MVAQWVDLQPNSCRVSYLTLSSGSCLCGHPRYMWFSSGFSSSLLLRIGRECVCEWCSPTLYPVLLGWASDPLKLLPGWSPYCRWMDECCKSAKLFKNNIFNIIHKCMYSWQFHHFCGPVQVILWAWSCNNTLAQAQMFCTFDFSFPNVCYWTLQLIKNMWVISININA